MIPFRIVVSALCVLTLTACASRCSCPEDAAAAAQDLDVVRGTVEGMMPDPTRAVNFRVDDGRLLQVTGERAGEIARLTGAEVELRGFEGAAAPRPTFDALAYRVLSVNGLPALTGTLAVEQGRVVLHLEDGERLTLRGADSLAEGRTGAKVWVTGERDGSVLVVASLGVIRDP